MVKQTNIKRCFHSTVIFLCVRVFLKECSKRMPANKLKRPADRQIRSHISPLSWVMLRILMDVWNEYLRVSEKQIEIINDVAEIYLSHRLHMEKQCIYYCAPQSDVISAKWSSQVDQLSYVRTYYNSVRSVRLFLFMFLCFCIKLCYTPWWSFLFCVEFRQYFLYEILLRIDCGPYKDINHKRFLCWKSKTVPTRKPIQNSLLRLAHFSFSSAIFN